MWYLHGKWVLNKSWSKASENKVDWENAASFTWILSISPPCHFTWYTLFDPFVLSIYVYYTPDPPCWVPLSLASTISLEDAVSYASLVAPQSQMLRQWPPERNTPGPIFEKVGIDYVGPFSVNWQGGEIDTTSLVRSITRNCIISLTSTHNQQRLCLRFRNWNRFDNRWLLVSISWQGCPSLVGTARETSSLEVPSENGLRDLTGPDCFKRLQFMLRGGCPEYALHAAKYPHQSCSRKPQNVILKMSIYDIW